MARAEAVDVGVVKADVVDREDVSVVLVVKDEWDTKILEVDVDGGVRVEDADSEDVRDTADELGNVWDTWEV